MPDAINLATREPISAERRAAAQTHLAQNIITALEEASKLCADARAPLLMAQLGAMQGAAPGNLAVTLTRARESAVALIRQIDFADELVAHAAENAPCK